MRIVHLGNHYNSAGYEKQDWLLFILVFWINLSFLNLNFKSLQAVVYRIVKDMP